MSQSVLPDFELAPLSSVDPAALVRDARNEVDQLFLSLALAYNDIKGLTWYDHLLHGARPDDATEVSAFNGQRVGIHVQLARFRAAILREVFYMLHARSELLESDEVTEIVSSLDARQLQRWNWLVGLALRKDEDAGRLAQGLELIRHVTFHYKDGAALANGYLAHFADASGRPETAAAYFSDGDTMEQTRFYYADAAAQQAMRAQGRRGGMENVEAEVGDTLREVNQALKPAIIAFLASRMNATTGG